MRVVWGSVIMAAAFGAALALLSYAPHDPSLNAASVGSAARSFHNLCGALGAYGADILWQFFGIGSFILPSVVAIWGWRIAANKGIEMLGWRSLATFAAMLTTGIAFGALKLPSPFGNIPLDGALGKVIGSNLVALLPFSWSGIALAFLFSIFTVIGIYLSCALTLDEWQYVAQTLHEGAVWLTHTMRKAFRKLWRMVRHKDEDMDLDEEEDEIGLDEEEIVEEEAPEEKEPVEKPVKRVAKAPLIKRPAATARQARLALDNDSDYPLPPLTFLHWPETAKQQAAVSEDALEKNAKILETVLEDFGVNGDILKISQGPVVTLYELEPSPGTRAARVISLADDIARNMSVVSVRVAIVPGRNVIGIEMPNARRETVYLRELLSSNTYHDTRAVLPLVLGKDIAGSPIITDLTKMPHLLIAGTTGSGKSVAINTMILSLLYRLPPQKCRFIMVDPKMLELSVYEGIPH
ncbi:MAG: DNA translocase FtsK 4TM domain-containing protein, partial [Bdellovibrionales bacterium]